MQIVCRYCFSKTDVKDADELKTNMKKLFLLLIFTLLYTAQAFAVDFTVNLTTDQHDASPADSVCDIDLATAGEQCSLRAAVEQANNLSSSDRVLFNLSSNSVITLTEANGGEIPILNNGQEGLNQLEIIGTGASNLTIDGGAGGNRIFRIVSYVTLSDVTLTGGDGSGDDGGAIQVSAGILFLRGANVVYNTSPTEGGAISGDRIFITDSAFSENSAGNCGAILGSAALNISNSTVSGNRATGSGGGICSGASLIIRSSTITNNTASNSGGVRNNSQQFKFSNTIIAGNFATDGTGYEINNLGNPAVSEGNNLIGDSPGDSSNTGDRANVYQSTDILDTPPQLGQLQNNGGTTPTHALLPGSPAIDKGNNSNSPGATDQRGFARIFNGTIDTGAFELETPPPPPPLCDYTLTPSTQSFTASGGSGSFKITTPPNCAFTSVSNSNFISITSGANGTGTQNVGFSVAANNTNSARTGTITVAGQTFTVTQAADKKRIRLILF